MKRVNVILLFLVVLSAVLLLRHGGRMGGEVQPPSRPERSNSVPLRASRPAKHYDTPWQAWHAKDYRAFIQLMRASGCPEETIQDLILMQLAREYQAQFAAISEARHMNPEWWHSDQTHASEVERQHSGRQLRLEMAARVHELLGVESDALLSRFLPWDYPRESWISAEKNLQLKMLLERFRTESHDIRLGPQGWWGPLNQDQKTQLAELVKSQRAELAAFLTPAELEEYDVRQSDVAWYVRQQLPPANSEQEFRAMVKIAMETGVPAKPEADERDPEYAAQKQAELAQKTELLRKINAALGPDVVAAQLATAQAQEKAEAERQARLKAENDAVEEQQWLIHFTDTAQEVGVDPALASKLFAQFKALKQEADANPGQTNITEEIAEQMAVDLMGEKGHDFVKKMVEKHGH